MTNGTKLRDETLYLMRYRPVILTQIQIAKDTGLTVDWLSKFQNGKIDNPGVVYVEILNEYLKNYKVD